MISKKIIPFFLLLLVSTGIRLGAQSLRVSIPEKEGVSSEAILNFVNAAEKSSTEFHSFMFLRHGKIIAQGWWNPYAPGLKHTLYSCSKSFTATAVGFAVSEKLLTVDDKVISFFPGELPDTVSAFLSDLKVKDVLSMTDGQDPDPTRSVVSSDSNWVKSFLALPILYKPGTKFLYNSLGTYMLSAIVQKVTGQKIVDYLKPRLFDPLGIAGMDWEVDPKGINTGGWGLRLKTEDMAKFAQLFLQKGKWNGKQVLPAAWVEEASTAKIIQHPEMPQSKRDSSDWEQGYCYQMWRCRHNAFRGDGAFGQFMIVMPEQDAVIAITAETPNMQEEINLVWDYLLPAMQKDSLPANNHAVDLLNKKLTSLALPAPAKTNSSLINSIQDKTFSFGTNDKQVRDMSLHFQNDVCTLQLTTDKDNYKIKFGNGAWQQDETTRKGPYLVGAAKASYVGLPPLKTDGAFEWKDENTLVLTLRYIESPHTEKISCHFDGNNISVDFENSLDVGGKKVTLNGVIKQ
jgi:CubicO group peptidase (beta-lactamase class C family)